MNMLFLRGNCQFIFALVRIIGKVTDVGDLWITVEVANGVSLKVQRSTIAALMPKDTIKNA